ncbi:MAG TPA: glutamine-synthetase adenylyltransferase, partial [Brevundimonas sp.]|nr:glutamine-synthetase adenylyltransferase [Brevundimonas sp.]
HILPEDPARRAAVAALAGEANLATFDALVEALLVGVNRRYGELFEGEEALSSPYGSLVFTGVENDPETLATLARMGFTEPAGVADTIRSWHHGRIPATRSARGRELFTRLAPRLLTALADTGAADAAFRRFAVFFAGLSAGVQVQALFLAQPKLFEQVLGVMAFAPRLARTLGRYPAALDSMMDARFGRSIDEESGLADQMRADVEAAPDFESALDVARRIHREQMFRIGIQTLTGRADPEAAGRAYTALAEAVIAALAPAAMAEAERQGGPLPGGAVAVVALGKVGSCEMTASSDLDLMTVYDAPAEALSDGKGWAAGVFYSRLTQRLIAALSAHTAEGGLYEVDMRLRPGAAKGPVSLRLSAVEDYYAAEADTWEFMALTRARVIWADDPDFGARVRAAIEGILRRPRAGANVAADARRMRELMARERPAQGDWDLKLAPGGQVDAEFVAQTGQLIAAPSGGVLTASTLAALSDAPELARAWRLQQALSQILSAAFDEKPLPDTEPEAFRRLLAEAAGEPDYDTLKARLAEVRAAARAAFEKALPLPRDGD